MRPAFLKNSGSFTSRSGESLDPGDNRPALSCAVPAFSSLTLRGPNDGVTPRTLLYEAFVSTLKADLASGIAGRRFVIPRSETCISPGRPGRQNPLQLCACGPLPFRHPAIPAGGLSPDPGASFPGAGPFVHFRPASRLHPVFHSNASRPFSHHSEPSASRCFHDVKQASTCGPESDVVQSDFLHPLFGHSNRLMILPLPAPERSPPSRLRWSWPGLPP